MSNTMILIASEFEIVTQVSDEAASLSPNSRRDVTEQEITDTWQQIKINPLFVAAWDIVCRAFKDGRRQSGTLHTDHARVVAKGANRLALMDNCSLEECLQNAVVGLLHDVKEDHPDFSHEVDNLVQLGLWPKALQAINLLTKTEGEKAFDNASRVMTSRMAVRAKLPDSTHNSSSIEQVTSVAFGDIKNSLRRYHICIPAYLAVLEGRYTDTDQGVKGYLRTIGQDLLIPENRDIFEKGFKNPHDILELIDLRSPILQSSQITITLPNFSSMGAKLRQRFREVARKFGLRPTANNNNNLAPMDTKRTLVHTASSNPSRDLVN